jgi:hypothetical protein
MRFSLKWILAGVAYVAIAAAAFSQTTWVYADILWAASLLAVVYAALISVFLRGRRQLAAAGFVVASFCFLLCLTLGGDSVPTRRLLVAAGVGQSGQTVAASAAPASGTWALVASGTTPPRWIGSSTLSSTMGASAPPNPSVTAPTGPSFMSSGVNAVAVPGLPPLAAAVVPPVDYGIYVRAGNAVGMMLIGLMGSLVGLLGYRAAGRVGN